MADLERLERLERLVRTVLREVADQVEPADDGLARVWDRIREPDSA